MQVLSLNGEWRVTQAGEMEWLPAQVPSTIHQDLLAAGKIEDPYYRDNEDRVQWVGEASWIYRRTFTVSKDFVRHARVLLRCHGLDTLATVVVNGHRLARTDNMFRTWEFDIRDMVVAGENSIEIRFASTPDYIKACQEQRELPCWAGSREIKGRSWVRKEPCNFGWDWGPVLITCGIWRPIELVAFDDGRLTDLHIRQDHMPTDGVVLQAIATVETLQSEALQATFTVSFDGKIIASRTIDVAGNRAEIELAVTNPQLWWPNGMGEQPLYTVHCELRDANGDVLDAASRRIGLRTLRLQRIQDAWGESFQFAVNGVPFFARGANWIPADTFAPRITREHYADLLRSAAEANMNMIRAWGGGIYEDDAFYDLCDELGLCVWQDFIFACSTYPTFDETFTQSVLAEVVDNITRLRHHPSIALWCGNNELEMGLVGQEWEASQMSWDDYTRLFDNMLPEVVKLLDPERDYWPASPHSPYGDREDFSNPRWGDAHLWDVWHKKQPFEWYRTCEHRFVSEFGFQSFPEQATVHGYTLPGERNVTGYVMEHHQRSAIGNSTILTYMLDWFQLPASFDKTLWLSQILQGMAMKYAVEHWRRSMPRTMGALYWQLNDCWPVASWSSIDYHGRWKALQYMAKRFNAPLLISGVEDVMAGSVAIHVTSDRLEECTGLVSWQLLDTDGSLLAKGDKTAAIPARQNSHVMMVNVKPYLQSHGPRRLLFRMQLEVDGQRVSDNQSLFIRPKHLELVNPNLAMAVEQIAPDRLRVTLTAEKPALWAWITADGSDARYSDNFVDIYPDRPAQIEVTLPTPLQASEAAHRLRACSLYDTYQED